MEEKLEKEVERQEEENTQTPVRMTMTMDEMEKTRTRHLSQCDSVNEMSATHLKTARSVLSAAR